MNDGVVRELSPRRRQGRGVIHSDAPSTRRTERDGWMLDALARMRFLTSWQIAQLFFGGSRSAANKRLRTLFDGGLLRVWVRSLNLDNLYSLAPAGHRLVSDQVRAASRCPRELDGCVDHLLAINSVRIALATTLPDHAGEIAWWRSDWELRAERRERIIPDALFGMTWSDGAEHSFALEVEYGTRAPRSFQGKLLRYASARHRPSGIYGVRNPIVLVVGESAVCLERYRGSVAVLSVELTVGFTTRAEVEQQGGAASIWCTIADAHLSLRELATLPNGREGWAAETRAAARACASAVAHKSLPIDTVRESHERP